MEYLLQSWWLWCVISGALLLMTCGFVRLQRPTQKRHSEISEKHGVLVMASSEQTDKFHEPLQKLKEIKGYTGDGFPSNISEVLEDLREETGVRAWHIKNREIARRKRQSEVLGAEIETAKKQIEYIRTLAERSSVVDEEKLRIAKLHQEMERLEIEDLVERKRLLKELEELERDIRVLQTQPEESVKDFSKDTPKSAEEKREEELQRRKQKHEHDLALRIQEMHQEMESRKSMLDSLNKIVAEINTNEQYTDEQKRELIDDLEDKYRLYFQ